MPFWHPLKSHALKALNIIQGDILTKLEDNISEVQIKNRNGLGRCEVLFSIQVLIQEHEKSTEKRSVTRMSSLLFEVCSVVYIIPLTSTTINDLTVCKSKHRQTLF